MAERILRISDQLPDGIRRIDPRTWRVIRARLEAVMQKYPEAAVVGSTALRLWREARGLDIPQLAGPAEASDIDIVNPAARYYRGMNSASTGLVGIYPREPLVEPKFTRLPFADSSIWTATPAHIAAEYAGILADTATIARDVDVAKIVVNYQIAKATLLPGEIETYLAQVPVSYGKSTQEVLAIADGVTHQAS